jgi:hypothetical protein
MHHTLASKGSGALAPSQVCCRAASGSTAPVDLLVVLLLQVACGPEVLKRMTVVDDLQHALSDTIGAHMTLITTVMTISTVAPDSASHAAIWQHATRGASLHNCLHTL